MQRKIIRSIFIVTLMSALIIGSTLGVRAYTNSEEEKAPFSTDKTDRTLIKDIYAQQQETLRLLKEIKVELGQLSKSLDK